MSPCRDVGPISPAKLEFTVLSDLLPPDDMSKNEVKIIENNAPEDRGIVIFIMTAWW